MNFKNHKSDPEYGENIICKICYEEPFKNNLDNSDELGNFFSLKNCKENHKFCLSCF